MRYKSALPLRFINSAAFDKCSARKRRWRRTTDDGDDGDDGRRWTVDWFEYYLVDVAAFAFLNDFPIWFPFGFHLVFGLVVRIMYANACVCVCVSVCECVCAGNSSCHGLSTFEPALHDKQKQHSLTLTHSGTAAGLSAHNVEPRPVHNPRDTTGRCNWKTRKKTGKVSIVLRGCKRKDNAGIWGCANRIKICYNIVFKIMI